MTNVLYIDCCIRGESSRTRALANAFLGALERRDDVSVSRLYLTEEPLFPLVGDFFLQRERLLQAGELTHPRFRYAHTFADADRIVIAAPFWDLSFPALLKIYFENVSVQGITFGCDAQNGCFGVCKAEKLLYLTTRGGAYDSLAQDNGKKYCSDMADFFGIPQFACVAADGLDLMEEPYEAILCRAKSAAIDLAETF